MKEKIKIFVAIPIKKLKEGRFVPLLGYKSMQDCSMNISMNGHDLSEFIIKEIIVKINDEELNK